ncbi:zinc finger protein 236 [Biomphalaria glabrata]|nr:zinc finger protein 236 [Biomphalaria glabrata]
MDIFGTNCKQKGENTWNCLLSLSLDQSTASVNASVSNHNQESPPYWIRFDCEKMSLDGQSLPQIQVENVIDYHNIFHVNLDPSLQIQGLHSLQTLPDGTTVAFIDPSLFDSSQIFDSGSIEVHQTLPDGTLDLQNCHQVVLEQPTIIEQIGEQSSLQSLDVKPPIGKGPFNCSLCDKIFTKWNQLQRHLKTHDEDKPFRCSQCGVSFNIEENLLLHMATHVGPDKEPICPECGKKFSRVASLKAHIMMHEREESLMCPECGDEFSLQHQLDKHMLEHRQEGMRVYQCRQCNQEYSKMSALKEHMKQHYRVKASLHHRNYKRNVDRSGYSYKCRTCQKTFQKPSQLERHERIHTGERPFKCNTCDRSFNQKGALQMHMTKHTGARPHTCTFCPMTFAQKGNLRSHIQKVHTLNKDEHGMVFECAECSCMFRRLGSLNAHISRVHADPGDSNQATVQDIKVPLQSHSLHHLQDISDSSMMQEVLGLDQAGLNGGSLVDSHGIHGSLDQGASDILQQALENSGLQNTVEDDHDTDKEGSGLVNMTSSRSGLPGTGGLRSGGHLTRLGTMTIQDSATGLLKRHYIRKVNGIRWHQCTYCSKEFKKPSDLVRHIRIHTHEKPYKCTQCFRAFAVKSTLTAHIKTHTGVKEFRCEVCSKMFSTQGSLKVHLRLHTGAKPFACTQCDKKFRTSAHCKSHIQSHFKDVDIAPRPRRSFKREARNDSLLSDIPLQEPILITDSGLIQQAPRNSMFPPFTSESGHPDRPYKCHHCRRGFKKSSHLKQHVRSHTGEKPYRCNLCQRSFVSSGVLKAHSRTHSGEKSYKCVVCDAMFTTGGSLKRHMSTHSEVRPFMCPYCQKTFKTSVNCKKHMKTHRHELAMQHYQTVKEGEGTVTIGEGADVKDDDEAEIVEEDGLTGAQALADLDVLQEHEIGHTTTVSQPDLQSVDLGHPDLQTGGVSGETMSIDSSLQQMLGSHFTLVNQQPFVQLTTQSNQQPMQEEKMNRELDGAIPRVTVHLESQMNPLVNSSLAQPMSGSTATQFTYQPRNWKNNITDDMSLKFDQQQQIFITDEVPNSQMEQLEEELHEAEDANCLVQSNVRVIQPEVTHNVSTNNSRRGHRCYICNKIFKQAMHLTQHMKKHSADKSFQCTECSKSFGSALVFKNHMRSSHPEIQQASQQLNLHLCPICDTAYPTSVALRKHSQQHHNSTPIEYICGMCNSQFKTALILKRHLKECQGDVVPTQHFVIPIKTNDENRAPRRGPKKKSLAQHQFSDEQVSISEKIYMDSTAEKDRISVPKDLQNQVIRRGRFANMCSHCPKSFKKPSDLQRHLRIHTGEKPFSCEICHRSFTVKSTLDSHVRTHKAAEKSFLCHVCNSLFSTKGSLKVHMRLHTGAKPFKCMHCDLKFRTSGHRKSHVASHFKADGVTNSKKKSKSSTQPLLNSSQSDNLQPLFLITQTPNSVQNTALNNQRIVGMNQSLPPQIVSVESLQGGQVISVDQSMLQNSGMMPVQLAVSDNCNDGSALPSQVLQGLDGAIQLHITAPLGQLTQGFQLTSLDPTLLQQVHIDSSVLQQLQQGGFITINPAGIQPTLTADLSQQVGSEMTHGVVVPSSLGVQDTLIGQGLSAETMIGQHGMQESEVNQAAELMGQTIVVSEALMAQIRNSEALMVHGVQARNSTANQQVDIKPFHIHPNNKGLVSHGLSDALLSQPSSRLHVSSGVTDSLICQSVHPSQDSFLPQGAVHVSDPMIGQDRLMNSGLSDGCQVSYSDGMIGSGVDHGLMQGLQLQPNSLNDSVHQSVLVQSVSALQDQAKSQGLSLRNATFVTPDGQRVTLQAVNVHGSSAQVLGLDEDEQKYTIPVEDGRMVSMGQLDQNPSMGHQGDGMDDEDEEEEEEEEDNEDVDAQALMGKSEVSHQPEGVDRPVEGTDRQHICTTCLKGFKRAAHLKEHLHTHGTGPVPKKPKATPHKCNVCLKAFQKPSQVERHMRIHTGERPYRCEICDKAFNQKNALQVHLRKHSGEKPHICPYCDASFVQSGNLKTHIKRAHHADMVSSMNISKTEVESRQDLAKSHIGTGLGEEQRGGMEGDDVGSVVDGMDLGEDVDLFVQQMG